VIEEIACAKLNLALHVLGRRDDGYHDLDTLFAFVEEGDRIRAEPAAQLSLHAEGPFAESLAAPEDNLVLRAAHALRERFGVSEGAALTLDKRLPVAAGLGGGSADAAAALRLLVRLWKLEAAESALLDIALSLGADISACLFSRTARGRGRGDLLEPLDLGLAGTALLLVNPRIALSTAAVFRRWTPPGSGPLPADSLEGGNDLEAPAMALAPEIAEVLERLRRCPAASLVRMSGSGATCFGLFESDAARDDAGRVIAAERPEWWRLPTRLV
jgi:4-diphosphocytidyl-2-C-methyl-D-erythritol kinase